MNRWYSGMGAAGNALVNDSVVDWRSSEVTELRMAL